MVTSKSRNQKKLSSTTNIVLGNCLLYIKNFKDFQVYFKYTNYKNVPYTLHIYIYKLHIGNFTLYQILYHSCPVVLDSYKMKL